MKWTNILQQHNDNGNMTRKEAGQGVMTMAWDDENRLLEVKNEGNEVSRYRYGHDGERVLKSTPDGQTTYVNEYLTIRSVRGADGSQAVRSRVATKHIFAGSERVATKRVDSTGTKLAESLFNKANCNASANSVIGFFVDVFMRNKTSCPNTNASDSLFTNASAVVEEKEAYFYHSDHLGSIGIVTRDGELHDYTVFLPFGEQWIFQSTNQAANDQTANGDGLNPLSPFQFTGKELDKYTGLTYFGARYYDPRVSVWLSADPILGSFIKGGMRSMDMNTYHYTAQNPINRVDIDGNIDVIAQTHDNGKIKQVYSPRAAKNRAYMPPDRTAKDVALIYEIQRSNVLEAAAEDAKFVPGVSVLKFLKKVAKVINGGFKVEHIKDVGVYKPKRGVIASDDSSAITSLDDKLESYMGVKGVKFGDKVSGDQVRGILSGFEKQNKTEYSKYYDSGTDITKSLQRKATFSPNYLQAGKRERTSEEVREINNAN